MFVDEILSILYHPLTAVSIAFLALIVALYTVSFHIPHIYKKIINKRNFVLPVFSLAYFHSTGKDFLKLISVLFTGATIFFFSIYLEDVHILENIQKGTVSLKNELMKNQSDTGAIATVIAPLEEISEETVLADTTIVVVEAQIEVEPPKQKITTSKPKAVVIKTLEPVIKEEIKEETPIVVFKKPYSTEPAPDITLSVFSQYGSQLVEGEFTSFSVVVENEGSVAMEETSFNSQLFIDVGNNGTKDFSLSKVSTGRLAIGEKETKIWKGAWSQKVGTHRAEVCADIDDALLETNEENNCISLIFTVNAKEVYGDLVVQNVVLTPQSPHEGENVSFSVQVANNDALSSVPIASIYLTINDAVSGKIKISSLAPKEITPVSWQTIWKAVVGSHTYTICADGDKKIAEKNEENNCVSGTFSVPEN